MQKNSEQTFASNACMLLFGENIIGLIVGSDVQAVASRNSYFTVCAWFYPLMAIMYCLAGVLEGAGDTIIAAVHSAASIITRLALTLILAPTIGFLAVAVSVSAGWGVAAAIVCARYFRVHGNQSSLFPRRRTGKPFPWSRIDAINIIG